MGGAFHGMEKWVGMLWHIAAPRRSLGRRRGSYSGGRGQLILARLAEGAKAHDRRESIAQLESLSF